MISARMTSPPGFANSSALGQMENGGDVGSLLGRWSGTASRHLASAVAVALLSISIAAVAVEPHAAFACSCEQTGTDTDTVEYSNVAFIGKVVSALTLDPALRDASTSLEIGLVWDVRYRVRVDEAVKGVSAGQVVVVYGSTMGSQCGANTLQVGLAFPIGLREINQGGWRRFQADTEGSCGRPASLNGFRALAARAGDIVPFESPNIEPAGSPETDDSSFNPAGGVVSFIEPSKSANDGLSWWPGALAVGLLASALAVIGVIKSGRRTTRPRDGRPT